LQLNNQVQNPELFTSFLPNGTDIINNFASISTKPDINAINSYFSLNDPKTIPKQMVNPQYIINKNDIKKEEKITNININDNALLEALTPATFESSSSSISSSPKSTSLTTTSSLTINNGFPLNNIVSTTTTNTIPYINTKADQIKFNNVYPLL